MNTGRKTAWMACTLACLLMTGAMTLHGADVVPLPAPDTTGGLPLMQALAQRHTAREFSSRALEPQTLANLLWAAWGINRPEEGKRTAPTAGNRQELDVYVTLPQGLFLYDAPANRLVKKNSVDLRSLAGKQAFTDTAPLSLVITADFDRMWEQADEATKVFYSAVDTGYVSQNIYLFCASHGLHSVALGMVDKEALAEAMGLRDSQRVILSHTVGYPPEPASERIEQEGTASALQDGTWLGQAEGYDDVIKVELLVQDGNMVGLAIVREQESAPGRAYEVLPGRIIEAQGTEGVDVVSGATVTSRAVLQAVEQAIEKARK